MATRKSTILFVEDEQSLLDEFPRLLERSDYQVLCRNNPDDALEVIASEERIDVAVLDLQLPIKDSKKIGLQESAGGKLAGIVLAREFRKKFPRSPIIFWSGTRSQEIREAVMELGDARIVSKMAGFVPVLEGIADALDGFERGRRPRCFIVHGHDDATMQSVRHYLVENLGFPVPTVLRDEPSHGRTIIEKLEVNTWSVDLAFVLLTPDDQVVPSGSQVPMGRARQNVVFEMGYFLGLLGRHSGRVIMLHRRPIELPSDIHGMIWIDITDGIESADAELRRELRDWLSS